MLSVCRAKEFRYVGRQTPDALDEAMGTLGTGFGPDDVSFRRAVGEHEPAGGVGAVGFNDVGGIHGILLGFRHLLDGADGDGFAGFLVNSASFAVLFGHRDLCRGNPAAIFALVGLMHDHALREQALEGFP